MCRRNLFVVKRRNAHRSLLYIVGSSPNAVGKVGKGVFELCFLLIGECDGIGVLVNAVQSVVEPRAMFFKIGVGKVSPRNGKHNVS